MNSQQRLKLAMEGKEPDRVPVWCPVSLEHIIHNGTSNGKIPLTIEEFVMAECNLIKRYGFDGLVLFLPGTKETTNIQASLELLINKLPGRDSSYNFENTDPTAWVLDLPQYRSADFFSSHLARQILGDDYHIGGWTPDGFSKAIQWFPKLDDALIAIIQDPIRFKAMVDYFDELNIAWAKAQVKLGKLESIHISSPYAGSSFISPKTFTDFVLPSVKKMATAIKSEKAFSYLHTCGFISDRLEWMAESGVDGIECLDPSPLGDIDLKEAKKRVGHKIFLKGNIDSVNVLLRASDEKVDQTIIKCLEDGMSGGGYILSTACSVAPAVPPERVQRLVELAERYGRY